MNGFVATVSKSSVVDFLVMCYSLRDAQDSPPVFVIPTDSTAHELLRDAVADRRMNAEVGPIVTANGRSEILLAKTRAWEFSPFERTVALDSDILVLQCIDELLSFAGDLLITPIDGVSLIAPHFRQRLERWRELGPNIGRLIDYALRSHTPAVNTGVFAFGKHSVLSDWTRLTQAAIGLDDDAEEIAMSLLHPHFNATTVPSAVFNYVFSRTQLPVKDARIIHFQGSAHRHAPGAAAIWNAFFNAAQADNFGNIRRLKSQPETGGPNHD